MSHEMREWGGDVTWKSHKAQLGTEYLHVGFAFVRFDATSSKPQARVPCSPKLKVMCVRVLLGGGGRGGMLKTHREIQNTD